MSEPSQPKRVLVICTGNSARSQMAEAMLRHLGGQPLAEMARIIGLAVQVVDIQADRASVRHFDPSAVTPWTYVVIMTQTHVTDEQVLRQVLDTPAAYIGMIGSWRKVQIIFDHLRANGVPEERLARVRAPIGLDLGGRSPEEIALAVLAEVVQARYGGSGQPRALGMWEGEEG